MTNIQSGYLKTKSGIQLMTTVPYPIGAIYLSVDNTNPSKLFGGTWEQIAKGRTLVGVDTSDTDFNTVKKTGGSKYLQSHYHNIDLYTTSDGSHEHNLRYGSSSGNGVTISYSGSGYRVLNIESWAWRDCGWDTNLYTSYGGNHQHKVSGITGSDGAGSSGNLQPYFTCYIWCRTA